MSPLRFTPVASGADSSEQASEPQIALSAASYRPEIDGLRAVAVVLVMFYHLGLAVPGGYIGVDVFFVISGYLITRIILRDFERGRFSLTSFWRRRICRIAPAALSTILVTVVASVFLVGSQQELRNIIHAAIVQPVGCANIYYWYTTDYFAAPAESQPLLHTWSLAVEEQFYLFYPPLLFIMLRYLPRRLLLIILLGTCGVSLFVAERVLWHDPAACFFLTPYRAWELLAGAVIAHRNFSCTWYRAVRELVSAGGLGLILWSSFRLNAQSLFPGLNAVAPCLGAVFIIDANSRQLTSVGKALAWKPIVSIGLASYSLYLLHWPLIVLSRHMRLQGHPFATEAAVVVLCGVLGWASWKYIETPARRAGTGVSFAAAARNYLIGTACLLSVTLSIRHLNDGGFLHAKKRLPTADVEFDRRNSDLIPPRTREGMPFKSRLIGVEDRGQKIAFLLWGDSHAESMIALCDRLAKQHRILGACCTRPGFVPLKNAWYPDPHIAGPEAQVEWNSSVLEWAKQQDIRHILLVSRWDSRVSGIRSGFDRSSDDTDAQRVFVRCLEQTASEMKPNLCRFWIVSQVPVQSEAMVEEIVTNGVAASRGIKGVSYEEYLEQQKTFHDVMAQCKFSDVTFIPQDPDWFDESGYSSIILDGELLYWDDDHVTDTGAEVLIKPLLEKTFWQIASDAE